MARQFEPVDCSRGAPMGRPYRSPAPDVAPPAILRVRRVRIDSGGYDDGGAYWGLGAPLWQLHGGNGAVSNFYRACTKRAALAEARALYPSPRIF